MVCFDTIVPMPLLLVIMHEIFHGVQTNQPEEKKD